MSDHDWPAEADRLLATAAEEERQSADRRDRGFADLVVFAVETTARNYPEKLIRALSRLFDLRAVQEELKAIRDEARTMRFESKGLLESVARDIEELERQTDAIQQRLSKAARAFDTLAKFWREQKPNGTPTPKVTR